MNHKFKIGDSKVLESREALDGTMIRRRRVTSDGKYRFTTYERIEMPSLMVKKRSGEREAFDRDKLVTSIRRSIGKFLNSELEVEEVVEKAMDILYELGIGIDAGIIRVQSVDIGQQDQKICVHQGSNHCREVVVVTD